MIIDSHHHFWRYDPVEYDWIDDSMSEIRRSFLPEGLKQEIEAAGVDGVVSVQARQVVGETDWLLECARANDFIRGVVGWLPISLDMLDAELDRLSGETKLRGLRHVVQSEAPGFLDGTDFNRGITRLKHRGLVYDILVFERQLEEAIRFVDRHPSQPFVLDHIAKPRIGDRELEPWLTKIRELAKRGNITCKVSGMVTEADFRNWSREQMQPYLDGVLEAFGPQHLMFGSDWPVCLLATGYREWAGLVRDFISPLSADEQSAIMGGTAARIYGL